MRSRFVFIACAVLFAAFQANAQGIPQTDAKPSVQTEAEKPLSIIFQPIIPGCPQVNYEILYPADPLVKKADAFAASLGLPLVHIMIGRHIDEECFNSIYAERPLDPKEEFGWLALVDAVRNPCYSFVFQDQIQIIIDGKFEEFLDADTLEYAVYHEVAHHVSGIERIPDYPFTAKELAVDMFVASHWPGYTRERALSNFDRFIEFKKSKQWDPAKLSSEVRKTLPDAAYAIELQKKYYLEHWK